jgi:hypothetical protein
MRKWKELLHHVTLSGLELKTLSLCSIPGIKETSRYKVMLRVKDMYCLANSTYTLTHTHTHTTLQEIFVVG